MGRRPAHHQMLWQQVNPHLRPPQLVTVTQTTEAFSVDKVHHDGKWMFLIYSGQVSSIKTIAALNQISTESASNLSDPESQKKTKRELRLGDRVLVRRSLNAPFLELNL